MNGDVIGNFQAYKLLADFSDFAEQAAGSNDFVALLQRTDHFFLFLSALHLRPNQHEIKQHENNNEWQKTENLFLRSRGGCGVGIANQHGGLQFSRMKGLCSAAVEAAVCNGKFKNAANFSMNRPALAGILRQRLPAAGRRWPHAARASIPGNNADYVVC